MAGTIAFFREIEKEKYGNVRLDIWHHESCILTADSWGRLSAGLSLRLGALGEIDVGSYGFYLSSVL
jgi:hypothetical protein